ELEREQNVILQEIGAAHDTPDDVVFDHFTETAFRHQTLGRSILGTPETVKSFTSRQLHDFMERQYGAERMVVVAAGDVRHDDFVREVEKRLAGFRTKAESAPPQYAQYVGGDFRENRDLMDAQVVLGFEGRAYHVRDFYASQVLSMILGGGMSSRLFQEVREKRGLCYSVYAFHWGFSDTGIFGVHAATGQTDIAQLVPVIVRELEKAGQDIQQDELDRARAQYRAGLIMSGESPASRASQIARQLLLFGRPVPKEELMERLSALTVDRLTDLSSRLFSTKPTLTAVGPVGTLVPYESVLDALPGHEPAARRLAV
ncbi:MAG: insulinase family protein, partial [Mesorhizobium sp.]|nr:insulinase family protein [Mesorhizobium sp.]